MTLEKSKNQKDNNDLDFEDIPLVGGLFRGIEKLVDLAEKVEAAGGEIKKTKEVFGKQGKAKAVYGFSIRTGIGGRPSVQTFGNLKPSGKRGGNKQVRITEEREPLVDVFDEKKHILIVAELPGISKESIKLKLEADILILEAGDKNRRYSKKILLPAKVDFNSRQQKFNNGVLEIKMEKIK